MNIVFTDREIVRFFSCFDNCYILFITDSWIVLICYGEQGCLDDVLLSRTAITDLIECLCDLPRIVADWRCSVGIMKCLLTVINSSHLCHPGADTVDFLSSWAMVFCHSHSFSFCDKMFFVY